MLGIKVGLIPDVPKNLLHWIGQLFPGGRLGQYILFVGVLGVLVFAYAMYNVPLGQPGVLLALWMMSFVLEWAPLKLQGTPLHGTSLSVSAAVAFAALLVLGPAAAILVNTGSALTYCVKEKRPFYKRLLTTAALLCSSALAGFAYVQSGGHSPLNSQTFSFTAVVLAAAVYFLSNSSLISGAVSLATGRSFRSVLANWQWLFLQILTSLGIGIAMALAYASPLGSLGFLMVSVLLVLPWYSTYFYVQKSRQVAEQHEQIKKANSDLEYANHALDLRVGELKAIHTIGISLNSSKGLPAIFQEILVAVRTLIGADASAIFLYDPTYETITIAAHIGLSDEYIAHPEMALNGSALRALRECHLLVMNQSDSMPAVLSQAAVNEGIRTAASLPLNIAGQLVGGLDICFKREHTFTESELGLLRPLAEQAAVAIQNARLMEQVHESYLSTIRALTATVEAKDPYTRGHSEVVRQLAIATGQHLKLSNQQIEQLNLGALFHDIGKIGISEVILNKPDRLTESEWMVMRQHPIIGEQILSKVPALVPVARIVLHHHERLDQRGYPEAICARDDLLAAIVSVCDSYQAMTSDRPYRKAFTHAFALRQIQQGVGTQFVPEVVEAFNLAIEQQDITQLKAFPFESGILLCTKSSPERLNLPRGDISMGSNREQSA